MHKIISSAKIKVSAENPVTAHALSDKDNKNSIRLEINNSVLKK